MACMYFIKHSLVIWWACVISKTMCCIVSVLCCIVSVLYPVIRNPGSRALIFQTQDVNFVVRLKYFTIGDMNGSRGPHFDPLLWSKSVSVECSTSISLKYLNIRVAALKCPGCKRINYCMNALLYNILTYSGMSLPAMSLLFLSATTPTMTFDCHIVLLFGLWVLERHLKINCIVFIIVNICSRNKELIYVMLCKSANFLRNMLLNEMLLKLYFKWKKNNKSIKLYFRDC